MKKGIVLTQEQKEYYLNKDFKNVIELLQSLSQLDTENEAPEEKEIRDNMPDNNGGDFWENVLEKVKSKLSRPSFNAWFEPTRGILQDGTLTIIAPNEFTADWLQARYEELIWSVIHEMTDEDIAIKFITSSK